MQPSPDHALPTAADVDAAARRLAGVALHTPLVTSPVLDALTPTTSMPRRGGLRALRYTRRW